MTKNNTALTVPGEEEFDFFNVYAAILDKLAAQLDRLPEWLVVQLKAAIEDLVFLVKDKRSPRFMLIGRRGSGKSSAINAIFEFKIREVGASQATTGRATWQTYSRGDKKIEILDTRGFREGGKPVEYDPDSTPTESILTAVKKNLPDAVLFFCKAKEADAGINEDLDDLEKIIREIEQFSSVKLPILAVLSQCDEVDPSYINNLPTKNEKKNANIAGAVEVLKQNIYSREYFKDNLINVVPISASAEYDDYGYLVKEYDFRWNIELLVQLLFEVLPKQAKLDFARLTRIRKVQKEVAQNVINICAVACGAIGVATPVPAIDVPIIIGIQTTMIVIIAYVSGREFSYQAAIELLAGLGMGQIGRIALREISGFILDFIPVFGDVVAGILDASTTKAIGEAAIAYFLDKEPIELVKQMYDQAKKEK